MFSGVCLAVAAVVTLWFGVWQWKAAPRSIRLIAIANLIMPIAAIFAFIRYAR
jgi:hypothetical protein